MKTTRRMDEVLQGIYILREEQGRGDLRCDDPDLREACAEVCRQLEEAGLVSQDPDTGAVALTPAGLEQARIVVRRHRLAERLLTDVLDFDLGSEEADACVLEHSLSPGSTRAICILLGHPTECPRGRPIPPGQCCAEHEREAETVVRPLGELQPGESGTIAHIATRQHDRMDRLTSLGIFPGDEIRVHQTRPSFIVQVGETTLALDPDVARDIRVRRPSTADAPAGPHPHRRGARRWRWGRRGQ